MSGFVPAAVAAWGLTLALIVSLAAGAAPQSVVIACVSTAAICAVAAALAGMRRRWSIVSVAAVCTVGSLSTLAYVATITQDLGIGQRATIDARVLGDMRVRDGFSGPLLDVRASLLTVEQSGAAWSLEAPILLRVPVDAHPPLGAVVRASGTVADGDPTRGYGAVVHADALEIVEMPGPLGAMAQAVRSSLGNAVADAPPRAAALIEGLAVGDETDQPADLTADMRVSGLSHLTAVSGGNTSIVVGAVLLVAAALGAGLRVRIGAAALALLAFVVVVGPQPSVLRAAVMAGLAMLGLLVGGRREATHALALTCVLLIVLSPPLATSWGFALSVAATAGLVLLARPVVERWGGGSRWRQGVVSALALTLGAQITTLPLIAAFGNGLSLVAIPANLLAAPAVLPVTVLGLLAAVVGIPAPTVAVALARAAEPFAAWIATVAQVSASLPAATLPWPGGLGGAALAAGVAGALVVLIRRHRGRHERTWRPRVLVTLSVALAAVAVLSLRLPDRAGWPPPGWIAVACDVGQGDALVLRGDSGGAVMVDAGPDPVLADRCLDDLGVDHIELLVLTHDHADHVAGVPGVTQGRRVDAALVSPLREPIDQALLVDQWLDGVPVATARVGEHRIVDGIDMAVLWPQRIIRGVESAPNNASVVLLATVQGVRFLLLGDVEVSAQVALRASLGAPGADVVKVPHHGSRVQDPALAAWTGGRIAVISVGEGNRYGHPAPETLSAWSGALLARTDQAGDIAIVASPLGVVTRRATVG